MQPDGERVAAAAPSAIVHAAGLRKTFRTGFFRRRVEAVRGVDLTVERGEILGLLGPNGAGKTTTIKMLMGLVFPSGGHATLFGQPIGSIEAKRRTGFLPESPYFYDYLTARELVDFAGRLAGVARAPRRQRTNELLDRVGLGNVADRALRKYSKGMLQRAGIAQALVHDPELVVLDEPMSGLDPIGRKDVRDLILELKARGKTVLFSTHILADVELVCDRIAFLVAGRILDVGTPGRVLDPLPLGTEVVVLLPASDAAALSGLPLLRERAQAARTSDGHLYALLAPGADVDAFVGEAQRLGARLVSVTPRRQSIEELFIHRARGASATSDGLGPGAP